MGSHLVRKGVGVGLAAIVAASSPQAAAARQAAKATEAGVSKTIGTYCAGCHNGRTLSAHEVPLQKLDAADMADNPYLWTAVYRQMQAGTMPPVGSRRPDRAANEAALVAIERALGAHEKPPAVASDQDVAIRLVSALWNSAPDAALLHDAQRGRLQDTAVLEGHVRRMLADDRAQAFISRFFFSWLELDVLDRADPDRAHFPDYDVSLRDSLKKEIELFLLNQVREDRDPLELWSADDTFLNEQLAKHYGVAGVSGPEFRRVRLSAPERAGLLGKGSVLMATSRMMMASPKPHRGIDAGYTTPATRARWVRLRFLGAPLPGGFRGAPPVPRELPITPQTRTLPLTPCVTCHRNFFPLGYALENFDPLGRWRTHDQLGPVDASGAFVDGTPTNGVVELRQVLLQWPEAFRTTLAEHLVVYVSEGKVSERARTPATLVRARQILRTTPTLRWSALIAAIVRSTPVDR